MIGQIIEFFSTIPHCTIYGRPWLAFFHLTGNLLVFGAYIAIPIAIETVRRRRHLRFSKMLALFATFILLCGISHLLMVTSVFTGNIVWYWIRTGEEWLTGLVSVGTAIYIFKLIPVLMEVPTVDQHGLLKERVLIYEELERWRQESKPPLKKRNSLDGMHG